MIGMGGGWTKVRGDRLTESEGGSEAVVGDGARPERVREVDFLILPHFYIVGALAGNFVDSTLFRTRGHRGSTKMRVFLVSLRARYTGPLYYQGCSHPQKVSILKAKPDDCRKLGPVCLRHSGVRPLRRWTAGIPIRLHL